MTLKQPFNDPKLAAARREYIQNLNKTEEFDTECRTLVPILERLWDENVGPFNFPKDEEHTIIWEDWLKFYTPQVLERAIHSLAERLAAHEKRYGSVLPNVAATFPTPQEQRKMPREEARERVNRAAGVVNLKAFYRSLVVEMKKIDDIHNPTRRVLNRSVMLPVLEEASGENISWATPNSVYDANNWALPADHRAFAIKMKWVDDAGKITDVGDRVLVYLKIGLDLGWSIGLL
jgi:hypothetical protein